MANQPEPHQHRRSGTASADIRRRALQAAEGGGGATGQRPSRVRAEERRRYVFQVWTSSAFAIAWVVVFVVSGSWLFVALAGAFAVLAAVAGGCLVVLRRRQGGSEAGSSETPSRLQ